MCLFQVFIDLSKLRRRRPQRCQLGPYEVVDLSRVEERDSEAVVCTALSVSDKEDDSLDHQGECQILPSLATDTSQSCTVESSQIIEPSQTPCLLPVCVALAGAEKEGDGLQFEGESHVPLPAALILPQNISVGDLPQIDLNQIDFTGSSVPLGSEGLPLLEGCSSQRDSLESVPSPFSLDSPYHCPSEIDPVLFSDESNMLDLKETTFTTDFFDHPAESPCMPYSSAHTDAQGNSAHTDAQGNSAFGTSSSVADLGAVWEEDEQLDPSSSSAACQSDVSTPCPLSALPAADTVSTWTEETQNNCTPNSPGRPVSGDSRTVVQTSPNLLYNVPCPQSCVSYPLPERGCQEQEGEILGTNHNGHGQADNGHDDSGGHVMSDLGPGMSGREIQNQQYISHIQLKKLKKQMGAVVQGRVRCTFYSM